MSLLKKKKVIDSIQQPSHSTLLVTPLKTYIVECTEVLPSFVATPIAGMNVSVMRMMR